MIKLKQLFLLAAISGSYAKSIMAMEAPILEMNAVEEFQREYVLGNFSQASEYVPGLIEQNLIPQELLEEMAFACMMSLKEKDLEAVLQKIAQNKTPLSILIASIFDVKNTVVSVPQVQEARQSLSFLDQKEFVSKNECYMRRALDYSGVSGLSITISIPFDHKTWQAKYLSIESFKTIVEGYFQKRNYQDLIDISQDFFSVLDDYTTNVQPQLEILLRNKDPNVSAELIKLKTVKQIQQKTKEYAFLSYFELGNFAQACTYARDLFNNPKISFSILEKIAQCSSVCDDHETFFLATSKIMQSNRQEVYNALKEDDFEKAIRYLVPILRAYESIISGLSPESDLFILTKIEQAQDRFYLMVAYMTTGDHCAAEALSDDVVADVAFKRSPTLNQRGLSTCAVNAYAVGNNKKSTALMNEFMALSPSREDYVIANLLHKSILGEENIKWAQFINAISQEEMNQILNKTKWLQNAISQTLLLKTSPEIKHVLEDKSVQETTKTSKPKKKKKKQPKKTAQQPAEAQEQRDAQNREEEQKRHEVEETAKMRNEEEIKRNYDEEMLKKREEELSLAKQERFNRNLMRFRQRPIRQEQSSPGNTPPMPPSREDLTSSLRDFSQEINRRMFQISPIEEVENVIFSQIPPIPQIESTQIILIDGIPYYTYHYDPFSTSYLHPTYPIMPGTQGIIKGIINEFGNFMGYVFVPFQRVFVSF